MPSGIQICFTEFFYKLLLDTVGFWCTLGKNLNQETCSMFWYNILILICLSHPNILFLFFHISKKKTVLSIFTHMLYTEKVIFVR